MNLLDFDKLQTSEEMFKYPSLRDAQARLNDTIIRINGTPSYIFSIGNGEEPNFLDALICYQELGSRNKTNNLPLKNLPKIASLSNLTLGYINYFPIANYLKRVPTRHTKQGITTRSIDNMPKGIDIFRGKDLLNTFNNEYPTLEEALARLNKEDELCSLAINKRFAITFDREIEEMYLEFQGNKVGIFNEKTKTVKLKPKHAWLKETLIEKEIRYA